MPIQQRFIIDNCHRKVVLQMMGRMWRNFKSLLTKKIKALADDINVATELEQLKPHKLAISNWEAFVKSRNFPAFQVSIFCHS